MSFPLLVQYTFFRTCQVSDGLNQISWNKIKSLSKESVSTIQVISVINYSLHMSLPSEVLDFMRSLRDHTINTSTLSDEDMIMIAKKFREFNERGISYNIRDMDHWVELAKPGWSYTVYTYIMYTAEIMRYAYQK